MHLKPNFKVELEKGNIISGKTTPTGEQGKIGHS